MGRTKGIFILDRDAYDIVYAPAAAARIARQINLVAPPQTRSSIRDNPHLLAEAEVIFSGWGCPRMDAEFLQAAPNLKAVFYAAGAINGWATPALWDRGILVTTANDANGIPVAEFTVASILLSLKNAWRFARDPHQRQGFSIRDDILGNYHSSVGLVGMGTIARLVVEMLKPFNTAILTHDPYLTSTSAAALGVVKVGLSELFAGSDAVSLHLPESPSTHGMINHRLLCSMKTGATLVNTARGAIINESDLIQALQDRPDLQAVLDVTAHEPLSVGSPLRTLPNVVLTPHIAGSQGRECQRMGQYMVEELDRYLSGEVLRWQVRPKQIEHSVHALQHRRAVPAMRL